MASTRVYQSAVTISKFNAADISINKNHDLAPLNKKEERFLLYHCIVMILHNRSRINLSATNPQQYCLCDFKRTFNQCFKTYLHSNIFSPRYEYFSKHNLIKMFLLRG